MSVIEEKSKVILSNIHKHLKIAHEQYFSLSENERSIIEEKHHEQYRLVNCISSGISATRDFISMSPVVNHNLEFSNIQKVLIDSYDNGDFSYIKTKADLDQCGDGLFKFLMVELSKSEDCDSLQEAQRRINTVFSQLSELSTALAESKDIAIQQTQSAPKRNRMKP